jgi:hypothetical protein
MTAAWKFVGAVEAVGKTAEGPHFQRTLMHRITQKLLQTVGEKRLGVVGCPAELGLPPYLPAATVPVRFQIGDWAFVTAVERMVRNGVSDEADASEAEEKHCPGRGLGHTRRKCPEHSVRFPIAIVAVPNESVLPATCPEILIANALLYVVPGNCPRAVGIAPFQMVAKEVAGLVT